MAAQSLPLYLYRQATLLQKSILRLKNKVQILISMFPKWNGGVFRRQETRQRSRHYVNNFIWRKENGTCDGENVQKFMFFRSYFGIPSMMVEGVRIKCDKIKIKFEIPSKGFFLSIQSIFEETKPPRTHAVTNLKNCKRKKFERFEI